ncbi:SDR family oxidoreductase [Photorhabdus antumapuensis]|uniref:SDR family oxidoreductase n=2 Tax=Photorhabdus antumapuensis TaxID=2862867 RepID=UPI001CEDC626|nr:SDR family oxidoreductase [Photorhabdus antumapuensis]MCA6221508.1 SDR family oxidoreductase [Photorhabdus antumapuensis]
MSEMDIQGRVVVITGASSGLGAEIARHLASKGAHVVLGARRMDKLEIVAAEIDSSGGDVAYKSTDVTQLPQVKDLLIYAKQRFGRVDVMVNNAGLMAVAPLEELRVEEWERMIDINVKGLLYGVAAALPIFRDQGEGHFINMCSVAGMKVFSPGGTVYSATKYAVRSISEGLRQEVGNLIRTTTICPGMIQSELPLGTTHPSSASALREFYRGAISADSVARAVCFAIEQPSDVDVNEIVVRPTAQDF